MNVKYYLGDMHSIQYMLNPNGLFSKALKYLVGNRMVKTSSYSISASNSMMNLIRGDKDTYTALKHILQYAMSVGYNYKLMPVEDENPHLILPYIVGGMRKGLVNYLSIYKTDKFISAYAARFLLEY